MLFILEACYWSAQNVIYDVYDLGGWTLTLHLLWPLTFNWARWETRPDHQNIIELLWLAWLHIGPRTACLHLHNIPANHWYVHKCTGHRLHTISTFQLNVLCHLCIVRLLPDVHGGRLRGWRWCCRREICEVSHHRLRFNKCILNQTWSLPNPNQPLNLTSIDKE